MKDVLICIDEYHDPDVTDGVPVFDGPRDEPVWALYEIEDGPENWRMSERGHGLTYQQAEDLADELGLAGRRIS